MLRRLLGVLGLALLIQGVADAGHRPGGAGVSERRQAAHVGRPTAAASRGRHLALERGLGRIDFGSVDRAPPVSARAARRLVEKASRKLGAEFRLDWESSKPSIAYLKDKPIVVPRGLVQSPGLTRDGLALILAHEAEHRHGHHSEARADYWALRRGLHALLGDRAFSGNAPARPLLAAYSALHSQFREELDLSLARPKIVIGAAGYPTVQSRWEILEAAIAGCGLPHLPRRQPFVEPELLSGPEAAKYLGVPVSWLGQQAGKPGGPLEIDLGGGPQYDKGNLEEFRARLARSSGERAARP